MIYLFACADTFRIFRNRIAADFPYVLIIFKSIACFWAGLKCERCRVTFPVLNICVRYVFAYPCVFLFFCKSYHAAVSCDVFRYLFTTRDFTGIYYFSNSRCIASFFVCACPYLCAYGYVSCQFRYLKQALIRGLFAFIDERI